MIRKIAIIGLGIITKGIVHNILTKSNLNVMVFSRRVQKQLDYVTNDLSECLDGADLILSCQNNDSESAKFWNDNIVLEYIGKKSPLCMEISTLSHKQVLSWAEKIENAHGKVIESPITGSRSGSENGTLSLFLYSRHYDQIQDVLALFSKKVYQFTKIGDATKFKLMYNMWGACLLYHLAEFLPIVTSEFTDCDVVKQILKTDGWMALVCQGKLDQVLSQTYDNVNFKYEHMVKDLNYALDCFDRYQMPIARTVARKYIDSITESSSQRDFSVICEVFNE